MKLLVSIFLFFGFKTTCYSSNPTWINYTTPYDISSFVSSGNYIWGASYGGLIRIDKSNNTSYLFTAANSGLRSNSIEHLAAESNGVLWMTYRTGGGIASFDGSTWNYFDSIPSGVVLGQVHNLKIDRYDKIWCTYDNTHSDTSGNLINERGLAVYDHQNWIVYPDSLIINFYCLVDFDIDTLGNVWMSSGCGVLKFDGLTTTVFDTSNTPMTVDRTAGITIDHNNILWVCTHDFINPFYDSVYSFDGTTWTSYSDISAIDAAKAYNIFTDPFNNKYFYNQVNGIYKYDNNSWSQLPNDAWVNNYVTAAVVDSSGILWSGSTDAGNLLMRKYDGMNGVSIDVPGFPILSDYGRDVAVDSEGNKWLMTSGGLIKFDGTQMTNFTPLGGHSFEKMLIDRQDNIWLCGSDNNISTPDIWKYDGNIWTFFQYNDIWDMEMDSLGGIWFAYQSMGLLHYDGSSMSTIDLTSSSSNFMSVTIDRNQRIWVAGYDADLMFDGSNWTVFNTSNSPLIVFALQVKADDAGYVWMPVTGGFYRTDGISWQFISTGSTNVPGLFNILMDGNHNYWMAAGPELLKFNGVSFETFNVTNTKMGSNYIFDITQDYDGNFWIAGASGGFACWNEQGITDVGTNPSHSISGTVYMDGNINGLRDPGEPAISHQKVIIYPDSSIRFTNSTGNYSFYVDSGLYEIKYLPEQNWAITSDSASFHPLMLGADLCCYDFGARADFLYQNIDLDMSISGMRCNSTQCVWLTATNTGTDIADVVVSFISDSNSITYGNSSPPVSFTNGDTLFWNLGLMSPFEIKQIYFQMNIPPSGINLEFHSSVFLLSNLKIMDTAYFAEDVRCSFDPNDKIVFPPGISDQKYTLMSDTLEYTIRFQNTGNDTAFNVIIRDQLDSLLDVSTLRMVASNHSCSVSCTSTGILEFKLDDINLPAKCQDEINSNGFVKYSIKAKSNLPDFSALHNSADIYFDFNAPITTNTTLNTMVFNIPFGIPELSFTGISIFPNPAHEKFALHINGNTQPAKIFTLYDITGRVVMEKPINNIILIVDRGLLVDGIYFWSVKSENGKFTNTGKVILN